MGGGDMTPAESAIYRRYHRVLAGYARRRGARDPDRIADLALRDGFRDLDRIGPGYEQDFRSHVYRSARRHLAAERSGDPTDDTTTDETATDDTTTDETATDGPLFPPRTDAVQGPTSPDPTGVGGPGLFDEASPPPTIAAAGVVAASTGPIRVPDGITERPPGRWRELPNPVLENKTGARSRGGRRGLLPTLGALAVAPLRSRLVWQGALAVGVVALGVVALQVIWPSGVSSPDHEAAAPTTDPTGPIDATGPDSGPGEEPDEPSQGPAVDVTTQATASLGGPTTRPQPSSSTSASSSAPTSIPTPTVTATSTSSPATSPPSSTVGSTATVAPSSSASTPSTDTSLAPPTTGSPNPTLGSTTVATFGPTIPTSIQPPTFSIPLSPGPGEPIGFRAAHSDLCLAVPGATTRAGVVIQQQPCDGSPSQRFLADDAGDGWFALVADHSGQCLHVKFASTDAGAEIIHDPCTGSDNSLWRFQSRAGGIEVQVKHTGMCFDVRGASTQVGAELIQWPCGPGANQTFGGG